MTTRKTTRPSEGAGHHDPTSLASDSTFLTDAQLGSERALAGALIAPAAEPLAARALGLVTDRDLGDPWCRQVVSTCRTMRTEQLSVDPVTVAAFMEERGLIESGLRRATLRSSLIELVTECPIPANVVTYARYVRQQAGRRRAQEKTAMLLHALRAGDSQGVPGVGRQIIAQILNDLDAMDPAGGGTQEDTPAGVA